jgi:hypothetical protein
MRKDDFEGEPPFLSSCLVSGGKNTFFFHFFAQSLSIGLLRLFGLFLFFLFVCLHTLYNYLPIGAGIARRGGEELACVFTLNQSTTLWPVCRSGMLIEDFLAVHLSQQRRPRIGS